MQLILFVHFDDVVPSGSLYFHVISCLVSAFAGFSAFDEGDSLASMTSQDVPGISRLAAEF